MTQKKLIATACSGARRRRSFTDR